MFSSSIDNATRAKNCCGNCAGGCCALTCCSLIILACAATKGFSLLTYISGGSTVVAGVSTAKAIDSVIKLDHKIHVMESSLFSKKTPPSTAVIAPPVAVELSSSVSNPYKQLR